MSILQTAKIFFSSPKLVVRSCVTLLNWLTNTMVYYGISFNTNELVGDPYLNFSLSVMVEFTAILACHFTLERFGRKVPYTFNMALAGVSLLLVQFVPKGNAGMTCRKFILAHALLDCVFSCYIRRCVA